jgi:hypothetical protein
MAIRPRLAAAVAVLATVLIAGAAWLVLTLAHSERATILDPAPPPPSDTEMIAHWEKARPALDQITAMLREDPALNRLGLTWSDPAEPQRAHVDAERIARYRTLMKEAAIISFGRGHRSIHFVFHARDDAPAAPRKGYVRGEYSPQADVIDSDLDQAAVARPKALLQRPIADGWWLQRDGT